MRGGCELLVRRACGCIGSRSRWNFGGAAPSTHRMTRLFASIVSALMLVACVTGETNTGGAISVRASIVNNLVLLDTSVNGSTATPFILDTGASATVIDTRLLTSLGLQTTGQHAASTGGGSVEASEVPGVDLRIGGIRLDKLTVAAIDLDNLSAGLGVRVGGILGYDLFNRFVVDIDYAGQRVAFSDPTAFRPPSGSRAIPLILEERVPFINARIERDGRSSDAKLEFDTGLTGALTLLREYVGAQRLLAPGQPQVAIVTGALLPGRVPATMTRMPILHLGPFELREVVTNVAPNAAAAGIDGDTVGLLGGDSLRRFSVSVDYGRQQVWLRASDGQSKLPMEFDMSGLSLTSFGEALREYRVRTVLPNSPAAEAGIAADDILLTIADRPAREMSLAEIRELLRRPGQLYVLQLRRGNTNQSVDLRTRRLL